MAVLYIIAYLFFFLDDLSWVDGERTFLSFPLHCWNTVDLAEWRVCTECNNIMLIYNVQWWIYAPKFLVVNTDFLNFVLVWLIVRDTQSFESTEFRCVGAGITF